MKRSLDMILLKKIVAFAREIEKVARDGDFPEARLAELYVLLHELALSEDPELRRLAEVQAHLHPQMTVRHFVNFMIPLERKLGVVLSDGEIIVQQTDRPQPARVKSPLIFVLDHLRSAFNVGSIFRLADSLAVGQVYLCGYTPEPNEKTALGSELSVGFEKRFRLQDALTELRDRGYSTYALETSDQATSLFATDFMTESMEQKTAFIVGNERFGIEAHLLEKSIQEGFIKGVVSIPMSGQKNSLNVACALSIVAFEWKRQSLQSR